ncbi:NUDIX hydrolase [Corynebacterium callunae]|uniref:NUDIX hydrolase n=1 Tax=Corynebacterium callunae TaxID=1721 RepID=UPI001FFFBDCE|nr:CoA pyrophosphatase [Corynebacterium callunae]MCK2199684.1 CoA pyrophosphatase [Corynebacterium callunae]
MHNFPDFPHDFPGENIELAPDKAPVWMHRLIERIQSGKMRDPLTGVKAGDPSEAEKRAAVLMLFAGSETSFDLPNDASVLLTHRSPTMRSHAGQIAFPGGRIDPTDVNAVDCAFREAWEETGLDRRSATPLAQLKEVHIRATGYPVYPILGHWHSPSPVAVASPHETDEVFDAPVYELIDPANRLMVGWNQWHGPAFKINDYIIWGFTGGLLSAILETAGWATEWDQKRIFDLESTLANSRNNENLR